MEQISAASSSRLGGELISAQVVARLTQELRSGLYAKCDRLPAEIELAGTLGVSRTVVRDALSELEREGFIERVRGIGTVINRAVVNLEHRLDQKLEFYSMIEAMGHHPHSDRVSVSKQVADEALADALHIATGDTVLCVCKRVLADSTPVLYSCDKIPLALFGSARLDSVDFSRPIFDILKDHAGVQTTSTVARVRAVAGDAMLRSLLNVHSGQALLLLEETCYSRLCEPLMRCETYYTDAFDFSMLRKLL